MMLIDMYPRPEINELKDGGRIFQEVIPLGGEISSTILNSEEYWICPSNYTKNAYELNRGIGNLLLDVPQRDIRHVAENIIEVNQRNEYTEYFDMVAVTANLSTPRTSQEALILYNTLLRAATG
eukprot:gene20965-23020_t